MIIYIILSVLAVALVATLRPITIRIEHDYTYLHRTAGSSGTKETPQTIEEADAEANSIYNRAKRFVKPFSERRARQRSIAANDAARAQEEADARTK